MLPCEPCMHAGQRWGAAAAQTDQPPLCPFSMAPDHPLQARVKALEAEVKASQDALSALVMHINATEEKVRSVTI